MDQAPLGEKSIRKGQQGWAAVQADHRKVEGLEGGGQELGGEGQSKSQHRQIVWRGYARQGAAEGSQSLIQNHRCLRQASAQAT